MNKVFLPGKIYRGEIEMMQKNAAVNHGEYKEWDVDKGPAHCATQEEKSQEYRSELSPVRMGRTMADVIRPRASGFRIV